MRHYQYTKTNGKLQEWLELCDLSLELFLQGAKQTNSAAKAERKAWAHLNRMREEERLMNQKVLMKIEK